MELHGSGPRLMLQTRATCLKLATVRRIQLQSDGGGGTLYMNKKKRSEMGIKSLQDKLLLGSIANTWTASQTQTV